MDVTASGLKERAVSSLASSKFIYRSHLSSKFQQDRRNSCEAALNTILFEFKRKNYQKLGILETH